MKRIHFTIILTAVLLLAGLLGSAVADDYDVTVYTFKQSPTVQPFFNSAYGYAVFPTIGKGGFVIGAAYGKGLVFRNEAGDRRSDHGQGQHRRSIGRPGLQ